MNGLEKKRDVGAILAPLPAPLFRVIGGANALLLLVLVAALPLNGFVVVWDVVVDDDGDVEDTDFKYFKLSQWLLYSIGVLGLKLRIRLRVSLTAVHEIAQKMWMLISVFESPKMVWYSTYFYSCSSYLRHFDSTLITNPPKKSNLMKKELLSGNKKVDDGSSEWIQKCQQLLTGKRVDRTTPQISVPTRNCSPSIAIHTFSHARSILFLRKRITHLPPLAFCGSSHIALMPLLNKCNSRYGFNVDGRIKRQ